MNPGEEAEAAAKPAPEAGAGPLPAENRRRGGRGGRGRGRGRGFGRNAGGGRERVDNPPAGESPRPSTGASSHKGSSIHDAIRQVERIRGELNRVLEDMNHVLQILDQAERDNTAADHEIEKLRESLHSLHREPGPVRYPRRGNSAPPPGPKEEPTAAPEAAEEWD